ncbi:hypothetical protein ABZ671_00765 [Micromonospora sp. NPDC006766]|uniref:hypothetical protein n=1 Tax=Micromonospora sp. NPDC006766 TaxID=3154778 RepID=UPI0033EDF741
MEITTGGHSIVIDADGPLDQVADKALHLWDRTRDPRLDRVTATGFSAVLERADGPTYAPEYDGTLHHPTEQERTGGG